MKISHNHILLLFLLITTGFSCMTQKGSRVIPDLRESYSYRDKKPFGSYVAFRQLEEMFFRNSVRTDRRNFTEAWNHMDDTASTYIVVARSVYTTDADVNAIKELAKSGNNIFIATSTLDDVLAEELGCTISNSSSFSMLMGKPYEYTGVKMLRPVYNDTGAYRYFYVGFSRYFSKMDIANTRVLGVNEDGNPNFIVIFRGTGKIFVHCEPRTLSNYFLLQKENYHYLQELFGYTRSSPDHIYWNDYYSKLRNRSEAFSRSGDEDSFSSLDEILRHPPLAAAFWLSIILLLIYVLFGGKRRQRIIEERKPNENTTVTFTETIGRLYLQKKDNKNIADKMIAYFNEYIRNNYFLNTNNINSDFITTLSRKSGVARDKVDSLYRAIYGLQNSSDVDDFQLLSLNEQIQQFFKTIR